jgi:hypothetical protein
MPIFILDLSCSTRISYVPSHAFCRRIEISVVRIFALTDSIDQGFALLVHQVSDWCSGVAIKMGRRLNRELVDTNSRLGESSYFSSGEPFDA